MLTTIIAASGYLGRKYIASKDEETKKKADGSEPMNLIKWSMPCSGECWS